MTSSEFLHSLHKEASQMMSESYTNVWVYVFEKDSLILCSFNKITNGSMFTSAAYKVFQALGHIYKHVILCMGCILNSINQLLIIPVTVIHATIAPIDISC